MPLGRAMALVTALVMALVTAMAPGPPREVGAKETQKQVAEALAADLTMAAVVPSHPGAVAMPRVMATPLGRAMALVRPLVTAAALLTAMPLVTVMPLVMATPLVMPQGTAVGGMSTGAGPYRTSRSSKHSRHQNGSSIHDPSCPHRSCS